MIYKGFKTRVRCIDWEQVDFIGKLWNLVQTNIEDSKVVALGMNWSNDYLYFDYALGVIDDEETLNKLKKVDFKGNNFNVSYFEIDLPELDKWTTFKGKAKNVKEIYEKEIDYYNKEYKYELEYLDNKGNIEIKIFYI